MKPQLELVPQEAESSIHAFRYEKECFGSPWHYHGELELTYIVNSSGMRYVGNNVQHFTQGDLVLLNGNLPHCWKNDLSYKGGAVSMCVQWKKDCLGKDWWEAKEFALVRRMLGKAEQGIKFTDPDCVKAVSMEMGELLHLSPLTKLIRFLSILERLSRCGSMELLSDVTRIKKENIKMEKRIIDILSHLEAHYHEKITLEQMAELTFMTKVSFCKFFKRKFNKSFVSYLNEYRVGKACQLLQKTDLKLLDIADQCGFNTQAFFHRQFLKVVGKPPNVYRKQFTTLL